MPRDSSGNYTLPAGINPVVSDTLIDVDWANPTLDDIANQLNNVLTRDGLLGPVTTFKVQDGTSTLPGLAFASQTGTGWWRDATQAGFSYQGTKVFSANASAVSLTKQIRGTFGTAALPGFSFEGNADTGMFRAADNVLAFSTAGSSRMAITPTGQVAVGITASPWGAGVALQLPGGSLFSFNPANFTMEANLYFDGATSRFVNNGYASSYSQSSGNHTWYTTPAAGIAGADAPLVDRMRISAAGAVRIAALAGSGTRNLSVTADGTLIAA